MCSVSDCVCENFESVIYLAILLAKLFVSVSVQ